MTRSPSAVAMRRIQVPGWCATGGLTGFAVPSCNLILPGAYPGAERAERLAAATSRRLQAAAV
jgi:hypothetical protein